MCIFRFSALLNPGSIILEPQYWQEKWESRQIGFHRDQPHPFLQKHIDTISFGPGKRILIPLCGKTVDIPYLLSRGFEVLGVELVETAVQELFSEMTVQPEIESLMNGKLKSYSAEGIRVFAGDLFDISPELLDSVDAIYDRASIVALPEGMRERYSERLLRLCPEAPQLIITFEYDQSGMDGPPFSVTERNLREYYGKTHQLTLLEKIQLQDGLKHLESVRECAWMLEPIH